VPVCSLALCWNTRSLFGGNMSQDELSYDAWLPSQIAGIDINDTNRAMLLAETKPCPKDGVDTGVLVDEEGQKIFMILAMLRAEYKKSWNEFQLLRPGDQKVLPYQRLVLIAVRTKMTKDLTRFGMRSVLPAWTYAYNKIGVDANFSIWVGGNVNVRLTDIPLP
jgi:hypothetical protein